MGNKLGKTHRVADNTLVTRTKILNNMVHNIDYRGLSGISTMYNSGYFNTQDNLAPRKVLLLI